MKLSDAYKKSLQNKKQEQQNVPKDESTSISDGELAACIERIENLQSENTLICDIADKEIEKLINEKNEIQKKLTKMEQKNIELEMKLSELEDRIFTNENEEQDLTVFDAIRIVNSKTEQKMKLDLEINQLQTKYGLNLEPASIDLNTSWERAAPVTDDSVQFGLSKSKDNIEKLTDEFQNIDISIRNDTTEKTPTNAETALNNKM